MTGTLCLSLWQPPPGATKGVETGSVDRGTAQSQKEKFVIEQK